MTEKIFIERKEKLEELIKFYLDKTDTSLNDKISLKKLSQLLGNYNYDNRLEIKGLLTRTIIDSLELSYNIGEKFIEFDNSIK